MTVAAPSSVLVYSHSWLPGQVDGVAVRMMAHVRALVDRGAKVTLVTPDFVVDGKTTPPKFEKLEGVEHVTVQTQLTPVYRKNLCMRLCISNFVKIMGLIRRVKPDIVHATQEASLLLWTTACSICDVPIVVSMHTDVVQIANCDDTFSSLGGMLGRIQLRFSQWCTRSGYRCWAVAGGKFLCVSRQSVSMMKDAGVNDRRVAKEIWGPMVDRNIFCIDKPRHLVEEARENLTFGIPNAYLLVYAGRVTAEKDIQFLVDALERAPKNVVLALIGPGSMTSELSKLHGKEHRLHCTGDFVSRERLAVCIRAADCCVSASTMETIGFTAMESLSCGTPFLAANAQGFAEHLSHDVNARLWTPYDPASFDRELAAMMATKLDGAWSRESLRGTMEMASSEHCTDRALRAYQEALPPRWRSIRVTFSVLLLWLNWSLAFIYG
eukprot:TRINITY_DN9094_c0_g1_i1.p1 TRINITY_DN9094_c0_g1~~TRINITY_DN9094_c0_g1_i1.p1  ORF type:complete len:438 (-),score=55.64 TRINITY_DN9094_c0_g1_i1:48-1361(-)